MYPCAQSVLETTLFRSNIDEISENASFDSEFAIASDIQPCKSPFFVFY